MQRLGGQVRVVTGAEGGAVTGWDMSATLQLGAALGIAPRVIAELLPSIEAVMVRKLNVSDPDGSGGFEGFDF